MKGIYRKPKKQQGIALVEFSIVALLFFTLIFAIIEFGRLLFTWHTLNEVSRRAARLASVCYVTEADQDQILADALVNNVSLPNFTVDNIKLRYLNADGGDVDTPLENSDNFDQIEFIEATIDNYQFDLIVPLDTLGVSFSAPDFSTRIPRESLGVTRVKDSLPGC